MRRTSVKYGFATNPFFLYMKKFFSFLSVSWMYCSLRNWCKTHLHKSLSNERDVKLILMIRTLNCDQGGAPVMVQLIKPEPPMIRILTMLLSQASKLQVHNFSISIVFDLPRQNSFFSSVCRSSYSGQFLPIFFSIPFWSILMQSLCVVRYPNREKCIWRGMSRVPPAVSHISLLNILLDEFCCVFQTAVSTNETFILYTRVAISWRCWKLRWAPSRGYKSHKYMLIFQSLLLGVQHRITH